MSDPVEPGSNYRVAYSERVRKEIRRLSNRARACGKGPIFVAAVREIDRRLRIYPQFGQPLRDLKLTSARLWVCSIDPLVYRYVIDEKRRLVMVVELPLLLPGCGIE